MARTYTTITIKTDDTEKTAELLTEYCAQNKEDPEELQMKSAARSGLYGMVVGVVDISEPYRCLLIDDGYVTYCDELDSAALCDTARKICEFVGMPLVYTIKISSGDIVIGSCIPGEGRAVNTDTVRYLETVGAGRYADTLTASNDTEKALRSILTFGFDRSPNTIDSDKDYIKQLSADSVRIYKRKK